MEEMNEKQFTGYEGPDVAVPVQGIVVDEGAPNMPTCSGSKGSECDVNCSRRERFTFERDTSRHPCRDDIVQYHHGLQQVKMPYKR